MSEEKLNFKIDPQTKDLVITHKKALDEQPLNKICIEGGISSPLEILRKRNDISLDDSVLYVDNEKGVLMLLINITSNISTPINVTGVVVGKLFDSNEFLKWKINSGIQWNPRELAEFMKMNRHLFTSLESFTSIYTSLRDVKINVEKAIESEDDNKGSKRTMVAQRVINSSIPESFVINTLIFKEMPKVSIIVEIYVDANTFNVTLVSPELASLRETYIETTLNGVLVDVEKEFPFLPVINS
jgi:hypothetical protein